ncbi:MAG: fibronectin type III domain-containing protein, partial [Bacteroidales bacterium]|nr:fibronectin type III domain-containing protein [Bacteroidales bacterium]
MKKHLILNALCILAVLAACTKPEPEPTPTPPEPQPEEVTSLEKPVVTATASGNTISVSWAEVKDAKSYKTEYHKAGEADFKAAGSGAERNCTIGSLEYSTEYVVRVQAIAGKVTSEWSDEVSVTTGELSISYPLT